MAAKLLAKSEGFFQVACKCGLKTNKTEDAILAQVKLLMDTYSAMMIKSKQLNNEIMSPAIQKDMEALKLIAPIVDGILEEENKAKKDTEQSTK
jgi:hypothetical protein